MIESNLNKLNISISLSKKKGYSLLHSKKIINNLIEVLRECIKENNLSIKNIGNFKILKKRQRVGRNPKTKEEFIVSARQSISFKASKNLTEKINF